MPTDEELSINIWLTHILLFTPRKPAIIYIRAVKEYEREEEQCEQNRYEEVIKYVNSMTKEELRSFVITTLMEDECGNKIPKKIFGVHFGVQLKKALKIKAFLYSRTSSIPVDRTKIEYLCEMSV